MRNNSFEPRPHHCLGSSVAVEHLLTPASRCGVDEYVAAVVRDEVEGLTQLARLDCDANAHGVLRRSEA